MPDVHDHVLLLAGLKDSGETVRESVPASAVGNGRWLLEATPGLTVGCAAGDVIDVAHDGAFKIVKRGGNVAIQVLGSCDASTVARLQDAFDPLRGVVEAPSDIRFVIVTVPVAAGFDAIESAANLAVGASPDVEWYFGNVYDEMDRPLNWWI